jgi:beta-1,2-mannobiose phosphorylase / 1,2-beta-oligomannan phosphorylase
MRVQYCLGLCFVYFSLFNSCSHKAQHDVVNDEEWDFPDELTKFESYEQNPIFSGTNPDSWDAQIRERGFILKEGAQYHLWYTGYNEKDSSGILRLGYATSGDGLKWERYPFNPIFRESWVEDLMVVKHKDVYYMFAEGKNDIAHLLTSEDKIHWEDHGSLSITYAKGEPLSAGPYGTPTAWIENDTCYLFYERNDEAIWLAFSTDFKTWTNVQDDPVLKPGPEKYDKHGVAVNQVIKYNDLYFAYYHGTAFADWHEWSTNVAVSKDLVHWRKCHGNPILKENKSSGIIVHDGTKFRLYTMHPEVAVHFAVPSNPSQ